MVAPSGGLVGGQTMERQVRAPATTNGGGSLPAHGLGVFLLGWAAILGVRSYQGLLVGL